VTGRSEATGPFPWLERQRKPGQARQPRDQTWCLQNRVGASGSMPVSSGQTIVSFHPSSRRAVRSSTVPLPFPRILRAPMTATTSRHQLLIIHTPRTVSDGPPCSNVLGLFAEVKTQHPFVPGEVDEPDGLPQSGIAQDEVHWSLQGRVRGG